jgi:hypothetical protein
MGLQLRDRTKVDSSSRHTVLIVGSTYLAVQPWTALRRMRMLLPELNTTNTINIGQVRIGGRWFTSQKEEVHVVRVASFTSVRKPITS